MIELVPSSEVLSFLSKSAPRAWIKRMLFGMICNSELVPYFQSGKSIAKSMALYLMINAIPEGGTLEDVQKNLEAHFDGEILDKLKASKSEDYLEEVASEWDADNDGPRPVSLGFFLYSTHLDWEKGEMHVELDDLSGYDRGYFADEDDLLGSSFDKPSFDLKFFGLYFERNAIELLQPSFEFERQSTRSSIPVTRLGRPRTWDWDGATTHLISIAQTPDGLPTGAGAQAHIERIIADWFVSNSGDAPSDSQVRKHAAKVVRAIKKPESS